jgi:GntR family transcriptional regulator, transcriptional repressor for pyruvate dehydrogenase complex
VDDVTARVDTISTAPPKPRKGPRHKDSWRGDLGRFKQASPRDAVSEAVLALIRNGELKPGTRLPSEPDLIRMTGVSRSSVREAIRSLETMGLLEIHRGKGTYIREIDTGSVADAQLLLLLADQKVLENLIEVRITLEPLLARLAAERATDDDVAALWDALSGMQQASNHEEWRPSHLAFHQALARASHNIILTKIWSLITMFLRDSPLVTGETRPRLPHSHDELVKAIADHDVMRAQDAMAQHIKDMKRVLSEGV